jgi:hypothetical protein
MSGVSNLLYRISLSLGCIVCNRASSKSFRLRLKRCFLGVAGGEAASNTQKRIFGGGFAAPEPPPEVTLT